MTPDEPFDPEAEQVRSEERREQAWRDQAEFKSLMRDSRFRRFVWRMMEQSRVFHDTSATDALTLAQQTGERRQGLRLLNDVITLAPEQWINMINDRQR